MEELEEMLHQNLSGFFFLMEVVCFREGMEKIIVLVQVFILCYQNYCKNLSASVHTRVFWSISVCKCCLILLKCMLTKLLMMSQYV